MDSLNHTRTINNKAICDNKVGQTMLTGKFLSKNHFLDWLKTGKILLEGVRGVK